MAREQERQGMNTRAWTHKVVKRMRGGQGEWFDFPAAATFGSEEEARDYARRFAVDQRAAGVTNFRIDVRSRRAVNGVHTVHTERG